MERVDVFQDNYGYWRARRGELYVGPQRESRDEALGDAESVFVEGDLFIAEGRTQGSAAPVLPPAGDLALRGTHGLSAGTDDGSHIPTVSIENQPGSIGPLVPAV